MAVVIDLDDEDEENKQDEDWVDKRDDKRRDQQQSSSSPSPPPPPPASTHRLRKRNKLRLPKQFNRLDVIYDDIDALLSTRVVASPPPTPSTNWPKGISTSSDESSSSDDSESDRSRDSDDDEDDSDEEDLAAMIDDSEVYSD